MKAHKGMKAQDIAILLFVCQYSNGNYKVLELGKALQISQSEISESLNRSRIAKLIDTDSKLVYRNSLYEFIVHGLRYVFPVLPGAIVRGMPTAHSGPPLNSLITSGNDQFVWSYAQGKMRGMAIEPLYKTLPAVCESFPEFYELLCLVDACRIGRAREMSLADEILKEKLLANDQ